MMVANLNRFRGSMVGSLIGDCLGQPFEYNGEPDYKINAEEVKEFFRKLPELNSQSHPHFNYTDDSAMMKCIANSFIENRSLNNKDLMKKFSNEYFAAPDIGYGTGVKTVFNKWIKGYLDEDDVFKAAKEQFNGNGSEGNGGAMRVAPVALFSYNNFDTLIKVSGDTAKLTHWNKNGYNGAILQALSIWKALKSPSEEFNTAEFLDFLEENMKHIEIQSTGNSTPFSVKLNEARILLNEENVDTSDVINKLGNGIRALESVVTAIFCFLHAMKPINSIKAENKFERTIQFAISLGGDTDTIACMAGAIAGAYYGFEYIPKYLWENCQMAKEFSILAEELYNVALEI